MEMMNWCSGLRRPRQRLGFAFDANQAGFDNSSNCIFSAQYSACPANALPPAPSLARPAGHHPGYYDQRG
jgi:hypothetical protein